METIKGYIDSFIFQNKENGYTVASFISKGEEIVCVGSLGGLSEGENASLTGEYMEHPIYGRQFKVREFQPLAPDNAQEMARYLGSGAIKGIGPALAARIVRSFGDETFRIMEEEPERLSEVKGISERMAREIYTQFAEKRELRDSAIFLQKFGISNALADKIYKAYGSEIYSVIQKNPYKLAQDIDGVGFKTADAIAAKAGIRPESEERIKCGILHVLGLALGEGSVYLPEGELIDRSAMLLGLDPDLISEQIPNLAMERMAIIKEKDGGLIVFSAPYYFAELNCASMLKELNISIKGGPTDIGGSDPNDYDINSFDPNESDTYVINKINALEKQQGIKLDQLQRKAIIESVGNGILILSGGPGTGKTTTINMIIRYFMNEGLDVLLAAPTGRAAKRMTQATGFEAKTIHRLLELSGSAEQDGSRAHFLRNEDNPLETDILVIDEASMVDIKLLESLLRATPVGTRLILSGDVNQLPSVGPGQVLKDMINSKAFPVVMLEKIFRQASFSDIVVNAHRIRRGEAISADNKSKDFFFLERNDINVIYKHMVQLITQNLPRYLKIDPYDIQVLTPMRRGSLGAMELNRILQRHMNPPSPDKKECARGDVTFREGDKVMQTKNDYQLEWEVRGINGIVAEKGLGVFNGDMGRIESIDDYSRTVTVEYDEGRVARYAFSDMEDLELSYAVTIHKSQGSEYPAVIMPLLSGPSMLMNRNLLYTGVTRARDLVTILGSIETVEKMIENKSEQGRYSALADRICESLRK